MALRWPAGSRSSDAGVDVKLSANHPSGTDWVALGGFPIKRSDERPGPESEDSAPETPALSQDQERERAAARLGDAVAEGMLERLVRVQLAHGPKGKHKESFRIKIVNESPLILNGVALGGRGSRRRSSAIGPGGRLSPTAEEHDGSRDGRDGRAAAPG